MNDAVTRLQALAESLPDGGSAVVPKPTLLEWAAAIKVASPNGDLTVREISERFGRAPSTIRSWLEQGLLRGYRLRGREWRVPPASIAEFEERERECSQPVRRPRQGSADLSAWRREEST